MAALIEAARAPDFPAEIALVLSNKAEARRASSSPARRGSRRGDRARSVTPTARRSRRRSQATLEAHASNSSASPASCASSGATFVERWRGRMLNIHPSLLPAFRGLHTHERALADGAEGARLHRPFRRARARRRPDRRPGAGPGAAPATTPRRWRRGCWSRSTSSTRARSPKSPRSCRAGPRPSPGARASAARRFAVGDDAVLSQNYPKDGAGADGRVPVEAGAAARGTGVRRAKRMKSATAPPKTRRRALLELARAVHQPRAVLARLQPPGAGGIGQPRSSAARAAALPVDLGQQSRRILHGARRRPGRPGARRA